MKVLFLTDSRGYGLHNYIVNHGYFKDQDTTVSVISKGGATLEYLAHKIEQEDQNTDVIVLLAGICSLTSKDRQTGLIHYHPTEEQKQSISSILANLRSIYNRKLIIGTILPANIKKHNDRVLRTDINEQPTEEQTQEQAQLEQDLENINNDIITASAAAGVQAIKLHQHIIKRAIRRVGKKRTRKRYVHISYENLYDGVHPNQMLKDRNFKHICEVTERHTQDLLTKSNLKIEIDNTSTESTSDSQEEVPSWKFKRAKQQLEQPH